MNDRDPQPTQLPLIEDEGLVWRPAGLSDAQEPAADPDDIDLTSIAPAARPGPPSLVADGMLPGLGGIDTDAPPVEIRRNRPWRRIGQELVVTAQTLLSAAVYATLIVTFGFQVARVDGLSMEPTLEDHDRLIVSKIVYKLGDPRPGDIVMLYYPPDPEKMFVKRVIAREGDSVQIVDGHVYVNDDQMADSYVPEEWRSHDNFGPEVIQPGYYFVMGDNRNNSSDSRSWGSVPKKYIVGKVKLRWWPIKDARVFE